MMRQHVSNFFTHAAVVSAVCVCAGLAQASMADLEAVQDANPNLWHQYKFEGSDDSTRLADTATSAATARVHLVRTVGEGAVDVNMTPEDPLDDVRGLASDITFENGADGALSQAYRPYYVNAAVSSTAGAALAGTNMEIPLSGITVEAIVKPNTKASPSDVNYIVMTRPGGDRGYLLVQDDDLQGRNSVGSLGSIFGNSFGNRIETVEYETNGQQWFYLVATFDLTPVGSATVNTYYANLTAGDVALKHVGMNVALTAGDAYEGLFGNVGIGAFAVERSGNQTDGAEAVQEFFQGAIDNAAIYNRVMSASELQRNLNAITGIPEPASLALASLGGLALVMLRRRRAR